MDFSLQYVNFYGENVCWLPEGIVADVSDIAPEDMSDKPLQSPQVASDNETAGVLQFAREVVKYENIRLRLTPAPLQSDVQQHLIRSRNECKYYLSRYELIMHARL